MDQMRMKAILTLTAAVVFAAAPLASPRFAGFDPGQMPVAIAFPPVQPAGYAFALWGLIYAWLVVHAGFGLLARATDPGWDRTRWPLIGAMVLGAPWIAIATFSPLWATILIWAMLAGALVAFFAAPRGRDRWLCAAPLGLLAGWLTAAAWVALSTLAAGYGVGTAALWGWAGLGGALALGMVVQLSRAEPVYGAALVWALIGVAAAALPDGRTAQGIAALLGAAVMAALAVRALRRKPPP